MEADRPATGGDRAPAPRPDAPGAGHPKLRRAGGLAVAVVIGLIAVVGLIVFFNSRDDPGVDQSVDAGPVPGQTVAADPQLDAAQDRLLAAGNVIVLYGGARPPAALVALRERLSGPPDPALTEAGQAVVLQRGRGLRGVEAHAWRRVLRAQDPADPRLEAFASYWLGRGEG
jgi:hypothetical protein